MSLPGGGGAASGTRRRRPRIGAARPDGDMEAGTGKRRASCGAGGLRTGSTGGRSRAILTSVEGLDLGGLLGGFSIYTILLAVLFGLVGFAAFRYGRKNAEP